MRIQLPKGCNLSELHELFELMGMQAFQTSTSWCCRYDLHPGVMCYLVALARHVRTDGGKVSVEGVRDLVDKEMGFYALIGGIDAEGPAVDPRADLSQLHSSSTRRVWTLSRPISCRSFMRAGDEQSGCIRCL